jgi:hypothetical protein
MIKFFRNIRKKLIIENQSVIKNTNYFKYAIGEIVLVVIGILIALQINNWNEIRKDKSRIANYLSEIINDLDQDIIFFKNNMEKYDAMIKIKEWGVSKINYDFSQKDSLLQFRYPNYDDTKIVDIAFNKMINSGLSEFYNYENIVNDTRRYYLIYGKKYNVMIDWDKKWTEHEMLWFFNDDTNYEFRANNFPTINSESDNINELIKSITSPKGRSWMIYSLGRKKEMYNQFESMLQNAEKLKFSIELELDKIKRLTDYP